MLARSGDITDPCPVPLSLTVTTPSSRMPALSHFWIRRRMRGSAIRCFRKRISQSWLTSSKEVITQAKIAAGSGSLTERYHSVKAILREGEQACEAIERTVGLYPHAETRAP